MDLSSKNPIKMIARANEFAWRKRQQAMAGGRPEALACFRKIMAIGRLLAELTDGKDQFVVASGLLYGLLEETDCNREEIEQRFGKEVARVVAELTLDSGLSKKQRREIELSMAAGRSLRGKMVTMADHCQAVHHLSPPDANAEAIENRIERLIWSANVVDQCRGAHKPLGDAFDRAYAHALDKTSHVLASFPGPEYDRIRSRLGDAYRQAGSKTPAMDFA